MPLLDDMKAKVTGFASTAWGEIPNAYTVPNPGDLTFDNSGKRMQVTILYADVHRSTEMVDTLPDTAAAEYYKAFLHCCGKLIHENGGVIEAYDGDRVMAIFSGAGQADRAVHTALQINWAVWNIINPAFSQAKLIFHRTLQHTVGIDSGAVLVAKTGVRGEFNHDLVWVGPAANYAAKLNSFNGLDSAYQTRISSRVIANLSEPYLRANGTSMWEGPYTNFENLSHYRSNWGWRVS